MTTEFYAISSHQSQSSSIHLGSADRGLRTYCGKLIGKSNYHIITNSGSKHPITNVMHDVTCTACKQTSGWKYLTIAAAEEVIAAGRRNTP